MGGALHAALDGRQQLAKPASLLDDDALASAATANNDVVKGDRPVTIVAVEPPNERILQVPTVTRVGDSNIIRKRPFAYATAPLAIANVQLADYPGFNPLNVFRSSDSDKVIAASDVIYGADIESEVRLQQTSFDPSTANFDEQVAISAAEAEKIVISLKDTLTEGDINIAALPYLDATRFELKQDDVAQPTTLDIRVVAENVSTVIQSPRLPQSGKAYGEEVVAAKPNQSLASAIAGLNYDQAQLQPLLAALAGELGPGELPSQTRLRIAWEQLPEQTASGKAKRIARRISVYRAGSHIKSIALTDDDRVVWGTQPADIPAIKPKDVTDEKPLIKTVARTNLPTVYDGIYRAALSQGLNVAQARRIVRTVAFDVDFKSRIAPRDELEVFYSMEDGAETVTDESEILYIGLTLKGVKRKYYRFRAGDDGSVDYYDENGKSAKKFLLRKPVPNGRFSSPFGPRRHPISRVVKMHQGVDFSAPRGTPIIAAGNGVVEKAGWSGGYGRQTIIRHANGYKTSYSHQHRIARNVKVGARITQGQIIGQVGTTGYSTGPHLHYEVIVNGRKVNPMRIRLPEGRSLKGGVLADFRKERDRINDLLEKGRGTKDQRVASLN